METPPGTQPQNVLAYARDARPRMDIGAMRAGAFLVTGEFGELPECCVKCGRDVRGSGVRVERKPGPGVRLTYHLCPRHAQWDARMFRWMLLCIPVMVAAIIAAALVGDSLGRNGGIFTLAILLVLGASAAAMGIFFGLIHGGPLLKHRVGGTYYFSNIHANVLNVLPNTSAGGITG